MKISFHREMKNKIKRIVVLLSACSLSGCATSSVSESETEQSCRAVDFYDYSASVPYSEVIDESYYDTALFAGDSRMGSVYLYGTHPNAQVEYVTSLNLLLIDTMPLDEHDDGSTLMDVLSSTDKQRIYMLFGINGIRNRSFDPFAEQYESIVTMLKEKNPEVELYIMSSYHPDYISDLPEPALSDQLYELNGKMKEIAERNHVYYLDLDQGLDGEDGTVDDAYVWDGLHLNPAGTHALEDFIATHVVRRDDYVQTICE